MTSKQRTVTFGLVLATLILFGCSPGSDKSDVADTRIIVDGLERTVEVPMSPKRIVSTSPEITEIIYAIGAQSLLVGNTTYCDYPVEAKDLPRVGTFSSVDIEKVASLDPDLIIATGIEQERIVKQLERLGVPVVVLLADDLTGIAQNIKVVGELTGSTDRALELIESIKIRESKITGKLEGIPMEERVLVYLEISGEPLMTCSDGTFVDEMIEYAGAKNIAKELPRPYSRIDVETIISANPDVIIVAHSMIRANDIGKRPGWSGIAAVRNDRVYDDVNEDVLFRAGPRYVEGIELLYDICYGDLK